MQLHAGLRGDYQKEEGTVVPQTARSTDVHAGLRGMGTLGRSRYQTSEFLNTSEFPNELLAHGGAITRKRKGRWCRRRVGLPQGPGVTRQTTRYEPLQGSSVVTHQKTGYEPFQGTGVTHQTAGYEPLQRSSGVALQKKRLRTVAGIIRSHSPRNSPPPDPRFPPFQISLSVQGNLAHKKLPTSLGPS